MRDWIGMIKRGLHKPPRVILARIATELRAELERFRVPRRRRLRLGALLDELAASDLDALWVSLAARPYPALTTRLEDGVYDISCPGDRARILARAEDALAHRVDLLGSGKVDLGEEIHWLKDFKTGFAWPARYFRDIEYNNPERPSDVKVPWELSRMQWLIPAGQAYLLTGDERYAEGVRSVLEHWIDSNPYAGTVNWACTMEVALRILTWTWFFHAFHESRAWSGPAFREKFLRALFLHVEFTERHIERSDVNGNHYTADAAGLVFGGLFFGQGRHAERWQRLGWQILSDEIERQVYPDGVDFEASVPYHRLVAELFLLPALYRTKLGMPVDGAYRKRLESMARFTAAYSKPDGNAPLWGDADDARALPFGGQGINDHRYLVGLVGSAFGNTALTSVFSGPREEVFWLLGKDAADALPAAPAAIPSTSFPDGGFYVMRNDCDHVFIDCGPIGLAGRGGHGHNDALSFEAVLNGVNLITDCGAYLYTADYRMRNRFRATESHNTPLIDGEEINRFIRPDYLWNLHDDAKPKLMEWQTGMEFDRFCGCHHGYSLLSAPVTPVRSIQLFHEGHRLEVMDEFLGKAEHDFEIPIHFSPGVDIRVAGNRSFELRKDGKAFSLWWSATGEWQASIVEDQVSPSYGRLLSACKIIWKGRGTAKTMKLKVAIEPKMGISQ